MTNDHNPLSDDELLALDDFLMHELETDEGMTLDMMDGFLHAIAIGPVAISPSQWLPLIWGSDSAVPPVESMDELNQTLGLVMRHFNSIIDGLEADPPEVFPFWPIVEEDGLDYENAEGWAMGFLDGVELCHAAWTSLLETETGQHWMEPIERLALHAAEEEPNGPDWLPLKERIKLAQAIPASVLAIYTHWLPLRSDQKTQGGAVGVADRRVQTRVGRNHPCPCGSGRKFRKCCGAEE